MNIHWTCARFNSTLAVSCKKKKKKKKEEEVNRYNMFLCLVSSRFFLFSFLVTSKTSINNHNRRFKAKKKRILMEIKY